MKFEKFSKISKKQFEALTSEIVDFVNTYVKETTELSIFTAPSFEEICSAFDLTIDQLVIICEINNKLMKVDKEVGGGNKSLYRLEIDNDYIPLELLLEDDEEDFELTVVDED